MDLDMEFPSPLACGPASADGESEATAHIEIVAVDVLIPPASWGHEGAISNMRGNSTAPYLLDVSIKNDGKGTPWAACKGMFRVNRSFRQLQALNTKLSSFVGEIPGFPVSKMSLGGLFGKKYSETNQGEERRNELAKWINRALKIVMKHAGARKVLLLYLSAFDLCSAVSRGDTERVDALLNQNSIGDTVGHPLDQINAKGMTVMHLAAFMGGQGALRSTEVMRILLQHAQTLGPGQREACLWMESAQGATPLLIAAAATCDEETREAERERAIVFLIDEGSDINVISLSTKESVLHLCCDSPLLTEKVADACPRLAETINKNGEAPLDTLRRVLAKNPTKLTEDQQNDITSAICGVGGQSLAQIKECATILEQQLKQNEEFLMHATKQGDHCEEMELLTQMGDLYINNNNELITACKLYNCALAVAGKRDIGGEETRPTQEKLASVESRILLKYHRSQRPGTDIKNGGAEIAGRIDRISQRVQALMNIRDNTDFQFSHNPSPEVLNWISDGVMTIFKEIVQEAVQECCDPPPCQYTVVVLGDLARREFTPYSRLQYAILLSKFNYECLEYFRMVAELIEVKVVDLMETAYNCLHHRTQSPIPRIGLSLDNESLLCPMALHNASHANGEQDQHPSRHCFGAYLLIGTPELIATLQEPQHANHSEMVSSALRWPFYALGDKKLFDRYIGEIDRVLDRSYDISKIMLRHERAVGALKTSIKEFRPRFNRDKHAERYFEARQQLYFCFVVVWNLCLYFKVRDTNSWDQCDTLHKNGHITQESANHIKNALTLVTDIIVKLKGNTIADIRHAIHADADEEDGNANQTPMEASDEDEDYTDSESDDEDTFRGFARFEGSKASNTAIEAAKQEEQEVECSKDDENEITSNTVGMESGKREKKDCQEQETLSLEKTEDGEKKRKKRRREVPKLEINDLRMIVEVYKTLIPVYNAVSRLNVQNGAQCLQGKLLHDSSKRTEAEGYFRLCHYSKATECFHAAVEETPKDASLLNLFGVMWNKLGDYERAIEYYQRAADVIRETQGEDARELAAQYNNLAMACTNLKRMKDAIQWLEKALHVDEMVYGRLHPHVAQDYHYLGMMFNREKEYGPAANYLQQALEINTQLHGKMSPEVSNDHADLGRIFNDMEEYEDAISHYQQAIKIDTATYGQTHRLVAARMTQLAAVHSAIDGLPRALELYEKATAINEKVYGDNHLTHAVDLYNLGVCHYRMEQYEKALPHLETSLEIHSNLLGEDHKETVAVAEALKKVQEALAEREMSPEEYEEWKRRMAALRAQRGAKDSKEMWSVEDGEKDENAEDEANRLKMFSSGKLGKGFDVFEDDFFEL